MVAKALDSRSYQQQSQVSEAKCRHAIPLICLFQFHHTCPDYACYLHHIREPAFFLQFAECSNICADACYERRTKRLESVLIHVGI